MGQRLQAVLLMDSPLQLKGRRYSVLRSMGRFAAMQRHGASLSALLRAQGGRTTELLPWTSVCVCVCVSQLAV